MKSIVSLGFTADWKSLGSEPWFILSCQTSLAYMPPGKGAAQNMKMLYLKWPASPFGRVKQNGEG